MSQFYDNRSLPAGFYVYCTFCTRANNGRLAMAMAMLSREFIEGKGDSACALLTRYSWSLSEGG